MQPIMEIADMALTMTVRAEERYHSMFDLICGLVMVTIVGGGGLLCVIYTLTVNSLYNYSSFLGGSPRSGRAGSAC